jgi:DNA (cytosine-5)-methyltransferase 1
MANILVRDISPSLKSWIEESSYQRRISQKGFVLSLLEDTMRRSETGTLPLFPEEKGTRQNIIAGLPFSFIDLFAGIGGMRLGLEAVGGRNVFSSEWDRYAQKTYLSWFGDLPAGDIRKIDYDSIPDHDLLAAGFPCQPFSIAGVSKKKSLGRAHGFDDQTQGTLFFHLKEVIARKRPPVVLLENVKNLKSHDGGRTWTVISETLSEELGYHVFHRIIDAADYVPQHRERIFIVCFDREVFEERPDFKFPTPPASGNKRFRDILDSNVDPKYTLSDKLWTYLQDYAAKHKAKGNGFGFGIADENGVSRTLSARYYKDGSEILINQGKKRNPRRLTPREAAKLMGFPDDKKIVVSDTQAYKQFGNAVVPLVVEAVGRQIVEVLTKKLLDTENGCLLKQGTITLPGSTKAA